MTVVSVEQYPELNQIARKRLGLPPESAGNGSPVRTEAIRARIEFQRDGRAMEGWATLAVVTHIFRAGRGSFYDCHATELWALQATKGKLDANEKLFRVIISSIRPEPQWQAYSNRILSTFYKAQAAKLAAEDQIIANLQNQIASTIMDVTANQARGANNSAFGADQNIRGVQTFRDPTTGRTVELSNLYDHAWLNGSNEYVMTDSHDFNPNGQLTGNWSQLQAVRPAP